MFRVAALWITPVKGMRLQATEAVRLGPTGADGNRRFHIVDSDGRLVNGKVLGELQTIVARCEGPRLELRFADGEVIAGEVALGEPIMTSFFSREVSARPVLGAWSDALSRRLGRQLTLVETDPARGGVDRGAQAGVSLFCTASLRRLGVEDARRFRMLMEVDGPRAHEEDGWVGHELHVGEAVVAITGHVGRCLVTGRDPDSGVSDLPTLDMLRAYRDGAATTEPLAFGVHGRVLRGGVVRVGDGVAVRYLA